MSVCGMCNGIGFNVSGATNPAMPLEVRVRMEQCACWTGTHGDLEVLMNRFAVLLNENWKLAVAPILEDAITAKLHGDAHAPSPVGILHAGNIAP